MLEVRFTVSMLVSMLEFRGLKLEKCANIFNKALRQDSWFHEIELRRPNFDTSFATDKQ